jgi:hypothetical protein
MYLNAQPYLKKPLKELTKRISDLKGIRRLRSTSVTRDPPQTGERVDEFSDNIVDVIANAQMTQERLNSAGPVQPASSATCITTPITVAIASPPRCCLPNNRPCHSIPPCLSNAVPPVPV